MEVGRGVWKGQPMNAEDIKTIGTGLAALFAGWQAYRANRQTKSTGNGFAKHVKDSLTRIEHKADATHELMVEHLADHAGSDLTRK